jgi:ferrous iron transport protein A
VSCNMCGSAAACDGCPIGADFFVGRSLASLAPGQRGTIRSLATKTPADLRKLLALGLLPGVALEVERRWPGFVLRMDLSTVALDAALAEAVIVALAA